VCAAPAWVARSDACTQPVSKDTGQYQPEESTALGDENIDTQIAGVKPRCCAWRALKAQAGIALGDRFSPKAFNDFIIAQVILPPALMKQAVLDDFIPGQRGQVAAK
jgi:hypothetical protein